MGKEKQKSGCPSGCRRQLALLALFAAAAVCIVGQQRALPHGHPSEPGGAAQPADPAGSPPGPSPTGAAAVAVLAATAAAARPGWNVTLDGYLRACQGSDTAAINVTRWMGRVGNRLWQLQTALVVAQASGRKYLQLPGDLDERVLALPRRLPVRWEPGAGGRGCDFVADRGDYDCDLLFFNRCVSTVAQRRRLYVDNVLPHVRQVLFRECPNRGPDVVTMHLRSGDVARYSGGTKLSGYHDQPPCLYYHKVIESGNGGRPFREIQLVYSKEKPMNPCIEDIMAKHKDKKIHLPSQTVKGDMCLILRSTNLAVTMSAFATTLKMLSKKLQRLFFVNALNEGGAPSDCHFLNFDFDLGEVCRAFPRAVGFRVLKTGLNMSTDDYFLRFPDDRLVRTSCG